MVLSCWSVNSIPHLKEVHPVFVLGLITAGLLLLPRLSKRRKHPIPHVYARSL